MQNQSGLTNHLLYFVAFLGCEFFFFHWHYSPLWTLACRTISFHFVLSITNSLHHFTPSTWGSLSASSLHPFPGLPLRLDPSISWVKIFLGILSSPFSPGDLTNLSFYYIPLLISFSSRFVLLFHSPFSYLGSYILLNIFLSKLSRTCSSFFVIVHVSTPYDTTGLISVLYNRILVALNKNRLWLSGGAVSPKEGAFERKKCGSCLYQNILTFFCRESYFVFLAEVKAVQKVNYVCACPTVWDAEPLWFRENIMDRRINKDIY